MERVQVSAHRHQPLLTGGQQDLKAGLREVSISRQCPGKRSGWRVVKRARSRKCPVSISSERCKRTLSPSATETPCLRARFTYLTARGQISGA
jgi:hypothetical protein